MDRARRRIPRVLRFAIPLVLLTTIGMVAPTLVSQKASANGEDWTNPQPLVSPFARFGASMAYDPITKP